MNLPYVPAELASRVRYWGAPMSTISGPDPDGLGSFRKLTLSARGVLRPGGWIAFQMIRWQWEGFSAELSRGGFLPLAGEDVPLGNGMIGMARYSEERS